MSLTFDDQFLLSVAEDGCLFTWKVFDKDGPGIKREREVGFAEEVLVTKTDMEEKVRIGSSEEGHGNSVPGCIQSPGTGIEPFSSPASPVPSTDPHSSLYMLAHTTTTAFCVLPTPPVLLPRDRLDLR